MLQIMAGIDLSLFSYPFQYRITQNFYNKNFGGLVPKICCIAEKVLADTFPAVHTFCKSDTFYANTTVYELTYT